MKPNKSGWISPFHKCRWLDLKNTKSCFWRNPAMNMIKKKAFGKKNEKLWVFTYIGLLIQNFINFIIISNIISVSFSGWKNMSLAKLVWGVMGAIGQARDGNWFITIAFCFPSIHICLGRKLGFVDLCVWIYLVWWAIITCGRKYQLSEVDAHMEDQLLLALLIGHISPISFFAICKQKMMRMRMSQRILILLQKRTKKSEI